MSDREQGGPPGGQGGAGQGQPQKTMFGYAPAGTMGGAAMSPPAPAPAHAPPHEHAPPPHEHAPPPPQGYAHQPPPQGYAHQPPPQGYAHQPPPQGYAPQQGYPPPHHAPHPGQPYAHPGYAPPAPGAPPRVTHVSTATYVALIWFGLVVGGVLTTMALTNPNTTELIAVCWAPLLVSAIAFWVLLHKSWAAIQDGMAETTPGKAVGFLFIPLFNLYWLFVALGGWGRAYNAFCDRQRVPGHRAPAGLFTIHCIVSLIPIASFISPFTLTAVVVQMCRGINALADLQAGVPPRAVARQM